MAELYKRFAGKRKGLDFSVKAKKEMFKFESTGKGDIEINIFNEGKVNGYAVGKKLMDITITMWKEDVLKGLIYLFELYEDFPHWFINKVFDRTKPVLNFDGSEIKERLCKTEQ